LFSTSNSVFVGYEPDRRATHSEISFMGTNYSEPRLLLQIAANYLASCGCNDPQKVYLMAGGSSGYAYGVTSTFSMVSGDSLSISDAPLVKRLHDSHGSDSSTLILGFSSAPSNTITKSEHDIIDSLESKPFGHYVLISYGTSPSKERMKELLEERNLSWEEIDLIEATNGTFTCDTEGEVPEDPITVKEYFDTVSFTNPEQIEFNPDGEFDVMVLEIERDYITGTDPIPVSFSVSIDSIQLYTTSVTISSGPITDKLNSGGLIVLPKPKSGNNVTIIASTAGDDDEERTIPMADIETATTYI